MKGKVKTLKFNDLVGYNNDMAVYPVTSILGVFDENNTDLKTILANLEKLIKSKADESTSSVDLAPVIISQQVNPVLPQEEDITLVPRPLHHLQDGQREVL